MRLNEQLLEHVVTLTPSRLPEPPPALRANRQPEPAVGWVEGATIGFRDFANEHDAMGAAWIAYRTLARRVAIRSGRRPIPVETVSTSLADDGSTILAAGRPIASLVRPGAASQAGDTFGFSLPLPSPEGEHTAQAMAHLVHRTLRRSGVRWGTSGTRAATAHARRRVPGTSDRGRGRSAPALTAASRHHRRPGWWMELHDTLRGVAWRDVAVRALAVMGVAMLALALLLGGARMGPVIGLALVGILGARVLATLGGSLTPRDSRTEGGRAGWPVWDGSGTGSAGLS